MSLNVVGIFGLESDMMYDALEEDEDVIQIVIPAISEGKDVWKDHTMLTSDDVDKL